MYTATLGVGPRQLIGDLGLQNQVATNPTSLSIVGLLLASLFCLSR